MEVEIRRELREENRDKESLIQEQNCKILEIKGGNFSSIADELLQL